MCKLYARLCIWSGESIAQPYEASQINIYPRTVQTLERSTFTLVALHGQRSGRCAVKAKKSGGLQYDDWGIRDGDQTKGLRMFGRWVRGEHCTGLIRPAESMATWDCFALFGLESGHSKEAYGQ